MLQLSTQEPKPETGRQLVSSAFPDPRFKGQSAISSPSSSMFYFCPLLTTRQLSSDRSSFFLISFAICLKTGLLKSRSQTKNFGACSLFGRWSCEGLWGSWKMRRGKWQESSKSVLMSGSSLRTTGAQSTGTSERNSEVHASELSS